MKVSISKKSATYSKHSTKKTTIIHKKRTTHNTVNTSNEKKFCINR